MIYWAALLLIAVGGMSCTLPASPNCTLACLNNGTCLTVTGSSNTTEQVCYCIPGYSGRMCQQTPCTGIQCAHNGTCLAKTTGWQCLCLPGFSGLTCNVTEPPACTGIVCGNGGV